MTQRETLIDNVYVKSVYLIEKIVVIISVSKKGILTGRKLETFGVDVLTLFCFQLGMEDVQHARVCVRTDTHT